jgi:hypothetical protein
MLHGNFGHVTSPTAPKESFFGFFGFFSNLRKRNRRPPGRIGLYLSSEDVLVLPLRPFPCNMGGNQLEERQWEEGLPHDQQQAAIQSSWNNDPTLSVIMLLSTSTHTDTEFPHSHLPPNLILDLCCFEC